MPNVISTWNGVWMLTSSSTAESSPGLPEPQVVSDTGHWLAGRGAGGTGASRGLRGSPPALPEPRVGSAPGRWLAGRVAVVTGASRGIGAATAAALAGAGAHVLL